ncbi:MAG: FlgD immunoglobulin-like domain containing protein [Bacteroidota bacterium]
MADFGEMTLALPEEFSISQNFPNPFNPRTEISFGLPEPSSVRVTILDVLGREILTLAEREYPAGYQRVFWKGKDATGNKVGSGVYFYRIVAVGQSGKQFTKVMKMALTK